MRSEQTEMWRFETANFRVVATIEEDNDVGLSFDETGETREKLESGEWQSFGTVVTVYTKTGCKLASDSLWGSIYAKPREFFTEHYGCKPKGYGSYFPDMVRQALGEARKELCSMPKVRRVA